VPNTPRLPRRRRCPGHQPGAPEGAPRLGCFTPRRRARAPGLAGRLYASPAGPCARRCRSRLVLS